MNPARPMQTHLEQSANTDLQAAIDKHDAKAFEVRPVVPKSPRASVIAVEPE